MEMRERDDDAFGYPVTMFLGLIPPEQQGIGDALRHSYALESDALPCELERLLALLGRVNSR